MVYLICYDIVQDRRRCRAAHLLEGYGMRVQKSVFECVLTQKQLEMVQRKLAGYIDETEDQVRFYPMSAHTRGKVMILGQQPIRQIDDSAFIV
ncbi:MAG: CRISPR-associated endonuclease Cas2 [Okeania sp. SIO2H7]|uniref:CRISPR-associated endonuclease Cas2 n=1 Tax=Okeania sp. SIO2G5 TaxID=2607796 RepID=UPI0013BF4654|nr:CRISPR-associated endonuclease Cas2 [Okeania sp. SIO2G5]NEP46993.1 CRISPR-associated endonuclease Cas2 [Okeania sp. SIO2H7]NEP76666.1 CRISPR-associated endonuclease Cas2 [Okeania sp. SIO2G5]